jgi:T5SS/PEP-CTERM-associated repeat protein
MIAICRDPGKDGGRPALALPSRGFESTTPGKSELMKSEVRPFSMVLHRRVTNVSLALVTGPGSFLDYDDLVVGERGNGTLQISSKSTVSGRRVRIADEAGSTGLIEVDDASLSFCVDVRLARDTRSNRLGLAIGCSIALVLADGIECSSPPS